MPGRGLGAGAMALGAYAVFLVAYAPASLVDSGVQRASAGQVRIAEAQGSAWSGTGQLEIRDSSGKTVVGKALSWRFQPRSLLRGRLGFDVALADAAKSFPLSLSVSGVELYGAEFQIPASALALAAPALSMIGLSGELTIRIAEFSTAAHVARGSGTVEWRSAGSALTPIAPLGDYEARIEIDAGRIRAFLRTLKGPLFLAGKGPDGSVGPPAFAVIARVEPLLASQLAPLLRLIAIDQGGGTFELQLGQNFGQTAGAASGEVR